MKIGVGDLSDDMHTSLRKHCDSSEAMLLYAAVFVVIDEWPSISWTLRMSAPLNKRSVANE